jgi:hypothetical protein
MIMWGIVQAFQTRVGARFSRLGVQNLPFFPFPPLRPYTSLKSPHLHESRWSSGPRWGSGPLASAAPAQVS